MSKFRRSLSVADNSTVLQQLSEYAKGDRPRLQFFDGDGTLEDLLEKLKTLDEKADTSNNQDQRLRTEIKQAYTLYRDARYASLSPVQLRRLALNSSLREHAENLKIGDDLGI